MHYLATLVGPTDAPYAEPGTPEFEAEVAKYADFEAKAAAAIAGGVALHPADTAVEIRHTGGRLLLSNGPFVEHTEVVGGFLVFDCADLDEAIELARRAPAAADGAVELRPMVQWAPHDEPGPDWWLALLWEAPGAVIAPDSPDWDAAVALHQRFGEEFGAAIRGGGAVQPPTTATTVRVRSGQLTLTDGPFDESADVIDGLYLFVAPDQDAATGIAARIPCGEKGHVELRRVVELDA
ncbi:YciI family protein [Nocardia sp. NPDC049149]|uniref:YciI family protein n=1 Tax=Nocardia sp. NPDC049149 TaxID=3364315 RepID=UPI0037155E2F